MGSAMYVIYMCRCACVWRLKKKEKKMGVAFLNLLPPLSHLKLLESWGSWDGSLQKKRKEKKTKGPSPFAFSGKTRRRIEVASSTEEDKISVFSCGVFFLLALNSQKKKAD